MAMPRGVLFAGLVLLLLPSAAIAQPVALRWDAPRECPDRSSVERSIAARLQGSSLQPTAAVQASARIVRQDGAYQLTLRTDQGERQLSAASCDELASSAALILAFIVDPQRAGAVESAPAAEPAPPVAERTRAAAAEVRSVEQTPAAARSPSVDAEQAAGDLALSGYARAEWLVDIGMLAHPGTGPGIAIGLTLVDTSLELSAGFLLNNSVTTVSGGEGRRDLAQLHAFSAQLGVCQRILRMPELAACVLGEHMRVTADPDAALNSRSTHSAPVWTVFGAARAAIPIGTRLAWLVELSLGVPLLGARFRVDGLGVIHETGDIVGRLRTGLELRF